MLQALPRFYKSLTTSGPGAGVSASGRSITYKVPKFTKPHIDSTSKPANGSTSPGKSPRRLAPRCEQLDKLLK